MESRKKVAICTATFVAMWSAGTPTRVISQTLKISADLCDTTRKLLKLPRRECWHGSKSGHRKAFVPTEAEIRAQCLKFQAEWTPEERARRRVGYTSKPVPKTVQVVPESLFAFTGEDESIAKTFLEDLADSSGL